MTPDSNEVLFQITVNDLETGLRGFPVGYCTTSYVDPEFGLHYRGHPIKDFVHARPEEVIFLLLSQGQRLKLTLPELQAELKSRASLSEATISAIRALPRHGHPMKLFTLALLLLGVHEGQGSLMEDALNLIAKMPELVALVINHHAHGKGLVSRDSSLGYVQRFIDGLILPEDISREKFEEVMRLFYILHLDHGGGNLSTFTGKAVASGREDLYGSIGAALLALAGPRHGRASQEALEMIQTLLSELSADVDHEELKSHLRERLADGKVLYGFGHAVLRKEDSRASLLFDLLEREYKENPVAKMALKVRLAGSEVLLENKRVQNPYSNVDGASGAALYAAGFCAPEYYTLLFGFSRVVGITAQILYETQLARGGKGVPIYRPEYLYVD